MSSEASHDRSFVSPIVSWNLGIWHEITYDDANGRAQGSTAEAVSFLCVHVCKGIEGPNLKGIAWFRAER